ncbi:MAG: hypothetical protein EOO60_07230 [Hymenobacter sp.]|nr:MAG: hypothetical protein EOO60_07230 [Hymenobacter sp.]
MKPTRMLLGLLVCCVSCLACRPPTWVLVSLTNRVAVRLPVQPQRHLPVKPEQFIHVTDSLSDYAISVSALPAGFTAGQRQELMESVVQVMAQSQKEALQAPTPFHLGSYEGVESAGLVSPTEGDGLRYTASRVLIVDDTYYLLLFSCPASRSKREAAGSAFLESLTLQSVAK